VNSAIGILKSARATNGVAPSGYAFRTRSATPMWRTALRAPAAAKASSLK